MKNKEPHFSFRNGEWSSVHFTYPGTIATNSDGINKSISEIASVSEEAAAGIEETAASVEQSSGSMEEITNSATRLNDLATDLKKLINKFIL